MSNDRRIELSVEVAGTPEEVWQAIATGPGISSWYVPHVVEERAGGAGEASFGEGPEMQIPGRVVVWEPPRRVLFDGGEGVEGMAFEWLVEAHGGGSCVVRLVNTGFGTGAEWDAQYDGMSEGWLLFLRNLQLHLQHFRGQHGTSMLPMASWPVGRAEAWTHLLRELALPAAPEVGTRVVVASPDAPSLAGTVVEATASRLALLLDQPAPGTAFLAAEGSGEGCGVSIWSYVYGPSAADIVQRDRPLWQEWMERHAPPA